VIKYRIGEWKNNPKQAEMGLPNTNTITLLWAQNKTHLNY
jgi:hypothetical protein